MVLGPSLGNDFEEEGEDAACFLNWMEMMMRAIALAVLMCVVSVYSFPIEPKQLLGNVDGGSKVFKAKKHMQVQDHSSGPDRNSYKPGDAIVGKNNVASVANHRYYDLVEKSVPEWEEISVKGRLSPLTNSDDGPYSPEQLNFRFPFYGYEHTEIFINPNGFLSFRMLECTTHSFCNWAAGNRGSTDPHYVQFIAPFMADLNPSSTSEATIHVWRDSNHNNPRFIVQYSNVPLYKDSQLPTNHAGYRADRTDQERRTHKYTFQVILYSTGDIQFNYKPIALTENPLQLVIPYYGIRYTLTIGIEDAAYVYATDSYTEYHPILLGFNQIAGPSGRSWIYKSFETCVEQRTCEQCHSFSQRVEFNNTGPLACKWCVLTNTCSNGESREIGDQRYEFCRLRRENAWLDFAHTHVDTCKSAEKLAAEIYERHPYLLPSDSGLKREIVVAIVLCTILALALVGCGWWNRERLCAKPQSRRARAGGGPAFMRTEDQDIEDDDDDDDGGGAFGRTGIGGVGIEHVGLTADSDSDGVDELTSMRP